MCPDEKERTNQLLSSWRCNPLAMPISTNRSAESILLTARWRSGATRVVTQHSSPGCCRTYRATRTTCNWWTTFGSLIPLITTDIANWSGGRSIDRKSPVPAACLKVCTSCGSKLSSMSPSLFPRRLRDWRRCSFRLLLQSAQFHHVLNMFAVWLPFETVDRHTSPLFFSCSSHLIIDVHHIALAQVSVCARHSIFMSSMMRVWSSVPCCVLVLSSSLGVSLRLLPLLFHTLPALWPALLLPCGQRQGKHLLHLRPMRSFAPWRYTILPQVMSPTALTTSTTQRVLEMIFLEESGDKDTEPSYLCDAELDDETIGKALSSPLLIQEREEPADRRQAYHSYEESFLPAQSFFTHTHTQERGDPYTNKVRVSKNHVAKWKTKESGFSLKDKKSKFSLTLEPRFRNTNFKPILMEEEFKNWMELSSLSEEKLIILLKVMNNFDEINYLIINKLSEQNRDLREAHMKSLHEMQLKRVQGSRFDEFSRRRLIENQDTINFSHGQNSGTTE